MRPRKVCGGCDGFLFDYCSHCKLGEDMSKILDSGNRREFESGAVRDMSGADKGRFDLLPWEVIWDLAKHFSKGAEKYGDYNWQKGIPTDSYFDSAIRHMCKHRVGMTDEDHLIAAIWNLVCMAWEERYSPRAENKETSSKAVEALKAAGNRDEIKHKPISKLATKSITLCDHCGTELNADNKGYYFQKDGKANKVCYTCYRDLNKLL